MENKILWVIAVLMGTLALVAGCMSINAPKGPYVNVGSGTPAVAPEDVNRVRTMDRANLEAEDLQLQAAVEKQNQTIEKQKREIKELKNERDQLQDRVDRLEKQIKDMLKR